MTETLDEMLARQDAEFVRALKAKTPHGQNEPTKGKRKTPERDAQRTVVNWLRKAGCIVQATFTEQAAKSRDDDQRKRFGQARKLSGATTGFPDLTVVTPTGRVVFVEMKSERGRLSPAQLALHDDLRSRDSVVIIGRDIWTVQTGLAAAGISLARTTLRRAVPVAPL